VRRLGGDAGEGQRLLWGAHLKALEVFPGEAQAAVEDGGAVVVGGWRQRHDAAVDAPQRLGGEEVEGRRQLEAAAEVLTEADGAAGERAFVAEAPSGGAEEAPPSVRWPA
jgi:hypothetical protein